MVPSTETGDLPAITMFSEEIADLLRMFSDRIRNPVDVNGEPAVVFTLDELRHGFGVHA